MKKVLEEGVVISQLDTQAHPYQIVPLNEGCLSELRDFQQTAYEKMTDKALYSPITVDMIRAVLGEKGLTLGLMVRGKMVGFICFYFPGDDMENLGRDAGLSDQELANVVHWERCLIDPEFRGNNMQFRLGELLVSAAKDLDRKYRYMCATVSPKNYPSLHQLFEQQNMVAVKLKIKYGNLWRYIYTKVLFLLTVMILNVRSNYSIRVIMLFRCVRMRGTWKSCFAKVTMGMIKEFGVSLSIIRNVIKN
jgi:hypothetical protein